MIPRSAEDHFLQLLLCRDLIFAFQLFKFLFCFVDPAIKVLKTLCVIPVNLHFHPQFNLLPMLFKRRYSCLYRLS